MDAMAKTPPKSSVTKSLLVRLVGMNIVVAGLLGLWFSSHMALASLGEKNPIPPAPLEEASAGWPVLIGAQVVLLAVVAGMAYVREHRAVETARVRAGLVKLVRVQDEPGVMSVRARHRHVPVDVIVRADREAVTRALANQAAYGAAFARLVDADPAHGKVTRTRRGIRFQLREDPPSRDTSADATDPAGAPPSKNTPAPAPVPTVPAVAPIPVIPADEGAAERIQDALRGAMSSDQISVEVTDTYPDGSARALWIKYPPSMTSVIAKSLPTIRDTMRRIQPPRADEWNVQWVSVNDLIIVADKEDPLAPIVTPSPVQDDIDLHEGVVIGVTETGEPWKLPLMGGRSTLVAAVTGGGKGSIVWGIILGVAKMVADGRVRLWVIDPKGGQELGILEGHVHRWVGADEKQAVVMLREAQAEMKAQAVRLKGLGLRKLEAPTRENPLNIIVIDELAELMNSPASGEVEALTSSINRLGRAQGYVIVACTQEPKVSVIPNRSTYPQAIALRLREANQTDMTLGRGARAAGAVADMIPKAHPGIGYVVTETHPDPVRVRAAFIDDNMLPGIVAMLRGPLDAPPIGNPVGDWEEPEFEPAPAPRKRTPAKRKAAVAVKERPTPGAGHALRVDALEERLEQGTVKALFAGDPDPVTIHQVEASDDEEGRWLVTYAYDGSSGQSVTDMEGSETVTLI